MLRFALAFNAWRGPSGFRGAEAERGGLGYLQKGLRGRYEGQDTSPFDAAVFSPETPLNTPVAVTSQWGVHLLLVERSPATDVIVALLEVGEVYQTVKLICCRRIVKGTVTVAQQLLQFRHFWRPSGV